MKTIKKPISILLAVLMVVSLFTVVPFTASAAEDGLYVDNVYANTTTSGTGWSFNTQTNTLTLENYNFNGVGNAPPNDSTVIMYYPLDKTLTIELKGTNTIVQGNGDTNRTWWGIYSRSNLVITGDGTLNVSTKDGGKRGAAIYCEKNITITGTCTVNAKCGTVTKGPQNNGICHGDNTTLTIGENANVTITGQNGESPLVASVTNGETTMRYITFDEALNAWTDGSTLKLLADVQTSSTINVTGTKTLDLNGYGIKMTGNGNVINVGSANLTLKDSNPSQTHKFDPPSGGVGLATLNEGSGTLTINGGYITGGCDVSYGGGILVGAGRLTMNGGNIIGNKAVNGGGVSVKDGAGTFTLNGGSVSYNEGTNLGGGIMSYGSGGQPNQGLLKINGGSVQYNTCPKSGGIFSQTAMELSGSPNISGNKANGKDSNLTFYGNTNDPTSYGNCIIKVIGELTPVTPIGVMRLTTGEDGWENPCAGVFTNSSTTDYNVASKFKSDDSAYGVLKNTDGQLELKNVYTVTWKNWNNDVLETDENVFKDTPPTFDGETPTKEDDDNAYTFTGWDPAPAPVTADTTYTAQFTATPYVASVTSNGTTTKYTDFGTAVSNWTDGSTLKLLADVTISSAITVASGTKTLDLNGKTVTMTGNDSILFVDGGALTVNGNGGTLTGGKGGKRYSDGYTRGGAIDLKSGSLILDNCKVTNNTANFGSAVFMSASTALTIQNDTAITGHTGAALFVQGATVNMTGGTISNNTNAINFYSTDWYSDIARFNMSGGSITQNQNGVSFTDSNGIVGAISVSGNAVIAGNTSRNLYLVNEKISVNSALGDGANIGITMQNGTGVFTNSTDTTLNDASKFFSDNSNYNVRKNPSGQLEIGKGYTVTWKNWDGTVLETDENVLADTTPTYDGAEPTRPSDSTNNYYFTGWEPTVDGITGDTTYTATYREQKQIVIKKGVYIRMGAYKDYYVDWFCALQNGTGSLMLTDCALRDMVFGSNSTYKTSNVHNWLDTKSNGVCDFATDLGLSQAEMNLARALNLSYGDGSEKFIIPSFEELKGTTYTKAKVIYDQNTTAFAYWLRTYRTSGGKKDNHNERVVRSQYSKVDERYRGVIYDAYVRPMFYIDTNKVKTMPYTGSGTKADPYVFETRQEVAKNVTILGSGAAGGGDVTATAIRSDITQRTDQKVYSSTLPNKLPTNSEVTVTATPSAGYEFVSMEVLDADNHRLAYTEDPENPTATFTLSGDVTVNAKFKKVNTITFYSDTEGTKVWKTVKRTAYEPISDMEPTVDNQGNWTGAYQLSDQNNELFTFGGWATEAGKTVWSSNGTDTLPEAFDWSQDMPDHDVELYPVWVANYINVRLDLGAYDAVAVADVAAGRYNWYDASRYDANTPATMESSQRRSFWKSTNITASTEDKDKYINMTIMNAAERAGYTLDGWYNSSGMKWEPNYLISREYGDKGADGKLTLTYDAPYRNYTYVITLTAKWNLNDAKVTYDVGAGTGDFTDDTSYQLGNIINIPSNPPTPPAPADPDIEEYVFRGWEDAKGDLHLPGEKFAFSEEALISTHGNPNEIKLTAKYQEIHYGTLAFLSQGGSLIDPIKSPVNTTVDLTQEQYKPVRSGYIFDGWYTEPEYTTRVDSIDIIVDVSKRVYAKWIPNKYHLLFYYFNGGAQYEDLKLAFNTEVPRPADPTRTGYTFTGWDKTIPLLMPALNMTFNGTWKINNYTVTYQLYDDVTNVVTQHYGETVVEPEKPTREGYTFERWVESGVEKTFPFIMPDENVTLTAEWKQNQDAPTNLTVTDASSDVSNDGKIDGVNDTMEYSLDGGKTWISVPADETAISNLAPGTVQIRYKAAEGKNPSPATEVEVKVKAKLFVGHSISLSGDVALNFLINPQAIGREDFSSFESAILEFTWDEGNGEKYGTASVDLKKAPRDAEHPQWFKATCNVVAAHMGYEVFAELKLNGAEEPIETDVYSVREYAEELYYNNDTPQNLKDLVKAMLNYGAAAQLAFQRDLVDDSVELANSNVGENDYKAVTPADIAAKIKPGASDMNAVASNLSAKYFTTSLLCLSENKLRVYFTPTTYPGQIPNSGGFDGNKAGYYYYTESEPIAAADLDEQQDLSVNGVTISLSALDYAKELAGDSSMPAEQQNLAKALFLYNQAANAYFGS